MKKIFLISLTFIALILAGCSENQPVEQSINISEVNFKYSSLSETPPETESIMYDDFFLKDDHYAPLDYICKNKDKAKIIAIDYKSGNCPKDVLGCGDFSRNAIICGENYVIEDFNLSTGQIFYGPYEIKIK